MEIPVSDQIIQAGISLILGMALGFIYDFLRVIRTRLGVKIITLLMDALFWLIAGSGVFLLSMTAGGGELRIFMTLFVFGGGVLYFLTLSRLTLGICNKLADFLYFLFRTLARPFVMVFSFLKKIKNLIKNIFKYRAKWYKIRYIGSGDRPQRIKAEHISSGDGKGENTNENQKGRYTYQNTYIRADFVRNDNPVRAEGPDRGSLSGKGEASGRGRRADPLKRGHGIRNRQQRQSRHR